MSDERFVDITVRRTNAPQLVAELDKTFATKTMAEWGHIMDAHNVWWAPVNTITEMIADPVSEEAGVFRDVEGPDGAVRFVATPGDFSATPAGPHGLAPELGQHTEEVLLELGYDWDAIIALKEKGAIP